MPNAALDRIITFKNDCARRQAQQVIDLPDGFAVLNGELAASYDHNKVILARLTDPVAAVASADRVLGEAHLDHRMVVVNDDDTGQQGASAFLDAGYHRETSVFMRHTGTAPDRPADPTIRVEPAAWQAFAGVDRQSWRAQLPGASEQAVEQLVRRRCVRPRAADEVTFLAIRDDAGSIVAYAELYLDAHHSIAQIEDVATLPDHRNRGHARAIMAEGLRRASEAGIELLFVEALADDWPRQLYTRLGYAVVGQTHTFVRPASSHLA